MDIPALEVLIERLKIDDGLPAIVKKDMLINWENIMVEAYEGVIMDKEKAGRYFAVLDTLRKARALMKDK